MTKQEILSHIDHTQLKAYCTWEESKSSVMRQLNTIQLLYVFHRPISKESKTPTEIK